MKKFDIVPVRASLSWEQANSMVNTVVESAFLVNELEGTMSYEPFAVGYKFKLNIAARYCDIFIDDLDMTPEEYYQSIIDFDVEDLKGISVFTKDNKEEKFNYSQLMDIKDAIDKKIEFKKQQLLSQKEPTPLDSLVESVSKILLPMLNNAVEQQMTQTKNEPETEELDSSNRTFKVIKK